MEIAIYNISGQETGKKAVLKDEIFGIEPNNHAIYLDVKQYLANRRQGTHKSKQRNEVAGSTRKLKKQKGTGGARAGSILSPLFPGGGRVFGQSSASGTRPLQQARPMGVKPSAQKKAAAKMTFAKGDTVDHKVFGRGTITKVDGDTLHVRFSRTGQTKKLLKDYAPIVKIG